jgi:hypothetical protein
MKNKSLYTGKSLGKPQGIATEFVDIRHMFEFFLITKKEYSKWDACLRVTNEGDIVKKEYMEHYKMSLEEVNDEYFNSGKYGLYL